MLIKLKALVKSFIVPTLLLIATGYVVDLIAQRNLYFWFDIPIIYHPQPYAIFVYFVLGLSLFALFIYSKNNKGV